MHGLSSSEISLPLSNLESFTKKTHQIRDYLETQDQKDLILSGDGTSRWPSLIYTRVCSLANAMEHIWE